MARAGILYSDVAKAAAKLVEDGKNPTVDSVREALGGTGSKSTIAPFLKRWKTEHQEQVMQAEAGLPPSLLAAVKGLHQHMQAEFEQQLEQLKQQHAEALGAATEREQQLRIERDTAIAARDGSAEELVRTREALTQLQMSHHTQSIALAAVEAGNAGLQQRLADRAAEVATLDHQLSQAHVQFEHYQKATAVQRTEERQAYDQRTTRLEQELADANRHIAAQQTTLGQHEAKIAHLTTDLSNRLQAVRESQEALAGERSARERLADRLEEITAAKDSLAAQCATSQQQLADIRSALAVKEHEVGILADQVRRAEARADQLTEEKLVWLQERATLEYRAHIAEQKIDTLSGSGQSHEAP
ncbi:MAG TPA: DNA-binding protein [Noviherbaspirillum sp.]|nr:DNA-binding protein [Noviherbaspirillum sp.]